ncbi:S-layer protein [Nitzschia inconspicua]|uniref:S-layer protein n=1 Tax=Nitzschia inconspicua TaxID=303405 RepID=A0A9K3PND7_9STRA|nr:S-layer protein [Nitzschia inconspicua]
MSSTRSRRSARNRGSNEVIAPGLGTKSDIARLTSDLGSTLPETAVLAMMRSEGRGIRSTSAAAAAATPNTPTKTDGAGGGLPFASPSTSNMWADFIQEEGVSTLAGSTSNASEPPKKKAKSSSSTSSGKVDYDLSVLTKKEKSPSFGSLVQTGTLDSTIVGRQRLAANETAVYHLTVPTVLMPSVAITKVFTSCNAAHAIAIDRSNQAYGWGRNEGLALGEEDVKVIPTPQIIVADVAFAALGKAHTIFLKTDGSLHAMGTNKSGQCGWRETIKQSGTLKPCLTLSLGKSEDGSDGSPKFCKVACGEDFSIALDNQGIMYTTGSSEFGQLGNGETGEYFVTANKLAFANSYGFLPQTIYHETDDSDDGRSDQNKRTVVIPHDVRIQDIAAGKHHALALEAPSNDDPGTRIFSWGCGNYGVLGHNRQKDEYFPRHVAFLPRGMTITKLAAGASCSLALTSQGHVYYWGRLRSSNEAVMKPQLVDALANNQHVVTHLGAGSSSIACTTTLGNTVVWGQGPHGELGLEGKRASAKPTFVDSLEGKIVSDLACGQGCTLFVIKDDKDLPKADLKAINDALKN